MNATLDAIRQAGRPSAAGLREVAAEQGTMLRNLKSGTTTRPTPAPSTQNAAQPGQMWIPGDLSYGMVDALIRQLKPCRYALRKKDGTVSFFEVSEYKGKTYLRLLSGAPGDYQRHKMDLVTQFKAVSHLLDDPAAAVKLYADERNVCAKCHSPLTDADSRARGLGPVCAGKVF